MTPATRIAVEVARAAFGVACRIVGDMWHAAADRVDPPGVDRWGDDDYGDFARDAVACPDEVVVWLEELPVGGPHGNGDTATDSAVT